MNKILAVVAIQAAIAIVGEFILKGVPYVPWLLGVLGGVASMIVLAEA